MQTYLVGGAVRNSLLGLSVHEKDWVVVGSTPDEMIANGYHAVGKQFPVFLHPETHEEYALARQERKVAPGHTGFDVNASPEITLEEDLKRRDLTINAIAQDASGKLIDPYHGQSDLEQRILRHVSEAFSEDPLRVFRVARFMSTFDAFGFRVAPETMALMQRMSLSGELATLPKERIWGELKKALQSDRLSKFFATLWECKALSALTPLLDTALTRGAHTIFTLMEHAAQGRFDKETQMALFFNACSVLCPQTTQQFEHNMAVFGLPKGYRQACLLIYTNLPLFLSTTQPKPQALLDLLNRMQAFRNSDRFKVTTRAIELLIKDILNQTPIIDCELILHLAQALQKVNHAEIRNNAASQEEFLSTLQRHRLGIIKNTIEQKNSS